MAIMSNELQSGPPRIDIEAFHGRKKCEEAMGGIVIADPIKRLGLLKETNIDCHLYVRNA
jgi:hypothetical protein